jgi:hypothetical protein
MGKTIGPKVWYTARDAAVFLGVTEGTVKQYCKDEKVKCKRVGPKKRWVVLGASLIELRREWGLD